jgi:hypothetical protein
MSGEIKAIMARGPFTKEEAERVIALVRRIDDERRDPDAIFEIMVLGGSGARIDQLLHDIGEDTLSVRIDRE